MRVIGEWHYWLRPEGQIHECIESKTNTMFTLYMITSNSALLSRQMPFLIKFSFGNLAQREHRPLPSIWKTVVHLTLWRGPRTYPLKFRSASGKITSQMLRKSAMPLRREWRIWWRRCRQRNHHPRSRSQYPTINDHNNPALHQQLLRKSPS